MKFKYCLNKSVKTTVQPKTEDELKDIIEDTIKEQGFNCDLNFIDTSKITDMSDLFAYAKFNGVFLNGIVDSITNPATLLFFDN